MVGPLTRRSTLGILGVSGLISLRCSASEEITKRKFMEDSLANVKKNGQKFELTTKMRFERIPKVTPFVDWDFYYLEGPLFWVPNPGQKFAPVSIPKGFVTDLASLPRGFWSVFPRTGRYAYAAIVHDYLYWFQTQSREEADNVLAAAMEDSRVDASTVNSFWVALRAAGGTAWDSNAKARTNGELRILAKFPDDPLISWEDWRKRPDVFKK